VLASLIKQSQVKIMANETGYTKQDNRIRSEVYRLLRQNEQTALHHLRVGVLNTIVHLAGEAPSLEIWELVQRIAEQVPGVRGVVNRIEAPGAPEPSRTIHLQLDSIESPSESGPRKSTSV
jgi:osmotically-inducible protein OsmY